MEEKKRIINYPKYNVALMVIGALLPYVYPPFITIIAVIVYYLSRLFVKKYNWVISLICLIINLKFTYVWYFDML